MMGIEYEKEKHEWKEGNVVFGCWSVDRCRRMV